MRTATTLVLAAVLTLGGCERSGPADVPLPVETVSGEWAARIAAADPAELAGLVRSMGREGAPHGLLGGLLGDDVPVAVEAAFGLGVLSTPEAVGELRAKLPADAPPEVVEAAALGLGFSRTDAAGAALIELCVRDDPPEIGLEALYAHYRGPGRTAPSTLPDVRLVRYAGRDSVRARAGVAWLARVIHDARLLGPVIALTLAQEAEVRRAAAMGLGQSSREGNQWDRAQAARCVEALLPLLDDDDAGVVVAACRALSSHERAGVVPALRAALGHADHNVRAAAIAALGRREAKDAVDDLERLAREDASVGVRHAAATTLAQLDAARAVRLADTLLAAPQEYLRVAGCDVLGAATGDAETVDAAVARLAAIAGADPHPRVRATALEALEGKQGDAVVAALRRALSEEDPVVVATACGVAGRARVEAVRDLVRAVPARFPTFDGADAREGAVGALVNYAKRPVESGSGEAGTGEEGSGEQGAVYELGAEDRALIESYVADEHPAVALTAARSLAEVDGRDAPAPVRTGGTRGDDSDLDGTGDVLVVETSKGTMRLQLDTEQAPIHCRHVTALARRGFYDGLTWHRVVGDFVIQGGCPRGDGSGSAGVTLPLEPTRIPFDRGVLGMPRSAHPDSGGCQLFVMHSRAPHLDVQYTAFGRVIEGLEVVDEIDVDDLILRVRVESSTER